MTWLGWLQLALFLFASQGKIPPLPYRKILLRQYPWVLSTCGLLCYSQGVMSTITAEEAIVSPAVAESDISAAEENEQTPASALGLPLKIVIGSSFLLRLAGGATGILLAAYLKRVVGAQADLIGLLGAIFYLSELLLSPIFGALSDLKGRRFLLVLGPIVGAVALPFYPLTTAVVILCLGRLLEGVSTAAKVPSALGYLADATSGKGKKAAEVRGRVMGMYEISFLVGLVAGSVMGGLLDKAFGTGGFYVLSLVYLAAAALRRLPCSFSSCLKLCRRWLAITTPRLPPPLRLPLTACGQSWLVASARIFTCCANLLCSVLCPRG